jgi:hypothetical protein
MRIVAFDLGNRRFKLAYFDSKKMTARVATVPVMPDVLTLITGKPSGASFTDQFQELGRILNRAIKMKDIDAVVLTGSLTTLRTTSKDASDFLKTRISVTRALLHDVSDQECKLILMNDYLETRQVRNTSRGSSETFANPGRYALTHDAGLAAVGSMLAKDSLMVEMGTTSTKTLPVIGGHVPPLSRIGFNPAVSDIGVATKVRNLSLQSFIREDMESTLALDLNALDVLRYLSAHSHFYQRLFNRVNASLFMFDSFLGIVSRLRSESDPVLQSILSELYIDSKNLTRTDPIAVCEYIMEAMYNRLRTHVIRTLLRYEFHRKPTIVIAGVGEALLLESLSHLTFTILPLSKVFGVPFSIHVSTLGTALYYAQTFGVNPDPRKIRIEPITIFRPTATTATAGSREQSFTR